MLHFGEYLHVNLDKPECYQAICKDTHQEKDQHYQIQVHSRAQLTWPKSTRNFSYTKKQREQTFQNDLSPDPG